MIRKLAVFLIFTSSLFAGPKTLKMGHFYGGNTYAFSETDRRTLSDGEEVDYPYNSFAAHYLTLVGSPHDRVDIYANLPYVQAREPVNPDIDQNQFSDLNTGIKFAILQNTFLDLALTADVKIPVSDYETNLHTSIGNGQTDYSAMVDIGKDIAFLWYQSFAMQAGYRHRTDEPPNEVFGSFSYTAFLTSFMSVGLFISHSEALGGLNLGNPGWNLNNLNIDFTTAGGKLAFYLINHILIEGSYSQTIRSTNSVIFRNLGVHVGFYGKIF